MLIKKLNDADFLKAISRSVRPSLVFDDQQSIIADMGASQLIDNILVEKIDDYTAKIVTIPKEFIVAEPVLESLDDDYEIIAKRGKKFEWIFILQEINNITDSRSPIRERKRFRLEIIR